MLPHDLLKTADDLLASGKGKPRQSNLRRAVSSAYYALFHTLAKSCADCLIGGNVKNSPAWRQAYRALDHGFAKGACKNNPAIMANFPQAIQDFGNMFVQMQEKRHLADYDPHETFYKSAVLADIAAVRVAIQDFELAAIKDRRAFAAHVMFRMRSP